MKRAFPILFVWRGLYPNTLARTTSARQALVASRRRKSSGTLLTFVAFAVMPRGPAWPMWFCESVGYKPAPRQTR